MIVMITGALVETLIKHMFGNYLDARDQVEIDGAPSWYMMPVDDQMCVFAHKKGDMDIIDVVKEKARLKMIKKIDDTIDIVIYDNMKNVKNVKEKEVINKWKTDSNLPIFINKNLRYSRVSYEEEINATFARACVSNNTFINYQKERLQTIKKEVLKFKSNSAIDEMENGLNGNSTPHKDPNDPFSELP